jgi:hypothetical protein
VSAVADGERVSSGGGRPGYGHALWSLVRAGLATLLVAWGVVIVLGALLEPVGVAVRPHTARVEPPFAWPVAPDNAWFRITDVVAFLGIVLAFAAILRRMYRNDRVELSFATSVAAAAALALLESPAGGSGFLGALVVAAVLPRVDRPRGTGTPLRRRMPRVLAAGGVAVALVLLAGCLVTANARPLAAAPGHGGGMTEGTGLLTPHYGPQRILYRHRPGGIGEFSVVVTNRSWTRDVTITGVASASLAPGPWRLRIPPADRGARAHAPIAVPSLDERTVPLELRFVPCAAGDRGQTFTLDTVPLVVAPGGGPAVQQVRLERPIATVCR